MIPIMRPLFHMSAAEAGSYMSAFYFGYIITQLPAGVIADRLGPRWILALSLLVPGFMLFMMQFMVSYAMGFWIRFVIGLFAGADMAAASRALTEWFPGKQRGVAWGFLMAGPSLGLLLPNWVCPPINAMWGWKAVFATIGIATFIIGILVAIFVRTSPTAQKSSGNPLGGIAVVCTSPKLLLLSFTGFSLMWAELGLATWANAYFRHSGLTGGQGGSIMVVYGCGAVLAPLTAVFWARLFGSMRRLIMIAFICQIPLTLIFGHLDVQGVTTLMIVGIILGYVSYMVNSPLNILITDVAGKQWAGSAIGTTNFIFQFASMIVPIVVGFSIDTTHNFGAGWYIITCGSLAGLIAISTLKYKETAI
jgi:sugar phosphate permease